MIVNLTRRLFEKLNRKRYRDAYVAEQVRSGIAYQIRALREQRDMQQGEFAEALGKPQSVVSRLENPDYGKLSLSTLLEVASTFDVALIVKYVSFPEFLRLTRDVSPEALKVDSFNVSSFVPVSSGKVIVETGTTPPEIEKTIHQGLQPFGAIPLPPVTSVGPLSVTVH